MIYDCVGMGITVLDELVVLDAYPQPNSKSRAKAIIRQGGGPVPTALATLARLGKRCALVTALGMDSHGRFLCQELEHFGVDTRYVTYLPSVVSPRAIILVDQSKGERTVLLAQDPACTLEHHFQSDQPFNQCRILHVDGHYPESEIQAAERVRSQGGLISLDIGSNRPVPDALLQNVDILVVSESYQQNGIIPGDPIKSLEQLAKFHFKLIGITCGVKGSYLYFNNKMHYEPAFKVTTIDSTGAGDVYHGALLFGFMQGFAIDHMARFAAAAAARKCGQVGGKAGIPDLQQVKQFLLDHNSNIDFLS
ncbi:hypothetical protein GX408_18830 [bacterium]|nr:hypothetical protein [bacterium]